MASALPLPGPPTIRPPSPPLAASEALVYTADKRSVRGGTLERLLRWVVIEQHDPARVRAFVYAYRLCATAQQLWACVVRLEESVLSTGDKSSVHQFIREWVQAAYEVDFKTKPMVKELLHFTTASMSQREANQIKLLCVQRDHLRGSASVLRRTRLSIGGTPIVTPEGRRLSMGSGSYIGGHASGHATHDLSTSPPISARSPPSLPSALSAPSVCASVFALFKTEVLTGTLTTHTAELVQRVSITEFINGAWTKPTKAKLAPGISRLTEHFNVVSFWVASEILGAGTYKSSQRDSPEARESVRMQAKRLKKAIKVAAKCIELHNYHDAVAIVSGLNLSCVQRLKRVWAALDPVARGKFDELDELLQPNSNWANYRDLLRSVLGRNVPVVPYAALYLRDLTFVQDGNPDTLPESRQLINFEKLELVGNQIAQFVVLRRLPYTGLIVDKRCQTALQMLSPLSEDALQRKSEECEPRKLLPGELLSYDEVMAKDWQQWAANDVAVWAGHNLGELYIEIFRAGAVDGAKLPALDDAALIELGVHKLGHRKRLLKLVQRLRERGDDDSSEVETTASSRSRDVGTPSGSHITRESSNTNIPAGAPSLWSEADVQRWLDSVGEPECKALFAGVNGAALLALDADGLERRNVERLGVRKRLARKISELPHPASSHHHPLSSSVGAYAGGGTVLIERTSSLPAIAPTPALRFWTEADLVHWLEANDLGEYSRAFQHMTPLKLLELNEDGIARLGVSKLGHRKRLQRLVEELRQAHLSPVRLPSSP